MTKILAELCSKEEVTKVFWMIWYSSSVASVVK